MEGKFISRRLRTEQNYDIGKTAFLADHEIGMRVNDREYRCKPNAPSRSLNWNLKFSVNGKDVVINDYAYFCSRRYSKELDAGLKTCSKEDGDEHFPVKVYGFATFNTISPWVLFSNENNAKSFCKLFGVEVDFSKMNRYEVSELYSRLSDSIRQFIVRYGFTNETIPDKDRVYVIGDGALFYKSMNRVNSICVFNNINRTRAAQICREVSDGYKAKQIVFVGDKEDYGDYIYDIASDQNLKMYGKEIPAPYDFLKRAAEKHQVKLDVISRKDFAQKLSK